MAKGLVTRITDKFTSGKFVIPLIFISIVMLFSILQLFVDPMFLIVGIVGLAVGIIIFKNLYFGLVLYLIIFLFRPGETYTALAPLRLEFLLGGALSFLAIIKNKYKYNTITIPYCKLNRDFLLLMGALALSALFSACKDCSVETITAMAKLGVFYLLILLIVDSKKRLEIFIWIFILAISKMAFDISLNFFQGEVTNFSGLARAKGGSSAVDNFNGIAITMNTVIPFVYFLIGYYKKAWVKATLMMILALLVTTLIMTGSRGGLLGFFAIVGMIWWRSKNKIAVAFAILAVFAVRENFIEKDRLDRYSSIFASAENRDESAQGRIDAWVDGMGLFVNRPITGVGAGAFAWARVERYGRYLQPHNMYIQIVAELGIIGTFIYFLFLSNIFRINLKIIKHIDTRGSPVPIVKPLANGIIIACTSLLVTGVFAHSGYRFSWFLFAAITAALERVTSLNANKEDSQETEAISESVPTSQIGN